MSAPPALALDALAGVDVLHDEPMSRHTSFGIGGPADVLAIPHSPRALELLLQACAESGDTPLIIGNGTNLLVRDGGIRGVVIKIAENLSEVRREGLTIQAQSGASLARLCVMAADWGLAGLGFAAGIPGTVGGAVWMNAGAWEQNIGSLVQQVVACDLAGREVVLDRQALEFSYRRSSFQETGLVIIEVTFALAEGHPRVLLAELCETIEKRCRVQPVAQPSAGCIFKRPPCDYAGRLVEAVGAKGLRVGGAKVSEKHANFIVNDGGATARDVLALLDQLRQRVFEQTGVRLEPEIRILGEDA
jgi:UDP-N-acetylmuramate dehydrogenase